LSTLIRWGDLPLPYGRPAPQLAKETTAGADERLFLLCSRRLACPGDFGPNRFCLLGQPQCAKAGHVRAHGNCSVENFLHCFRAVFGRNALPFQPGCRFRRRGFPHRLYVGIHRKIVNPARNGPDCVRGRTGAANLRGGLRLYPRIKLAAVRGVKGRFLRRRHRSTSAAQQK
jgi:hypothetical protein